jgi:phospholipid transport system substrate-binding protein
MRFRLTTLLVALLFALPTVAHCEADGSAVIRKFCGQLLETMKHGPQLGFEGRVKKLEPAIVAAYDMPAMTKSILGVSAAKLSEDQAGQLTKAFTRYSVATYADQFKSWDGERFTVDAPRPSANGNVVVPGSIVPGSGSPTEIDYVMHQDANGQWKIIDVLLDGTISQVAVRRSEFLSIYRSKGLSGLIAMLDSRATAIGND